jgi:pyruvate/2-oxoglutarate dehydrogenase complex dihydrolipoamide dehydrogenase (E3) component
MNEPEYDLAIVGGGAAGLIAADFAIRLGARVALLENERIGGDCTWTGCVPSKSLIKAANVAQQIRVASRYGLHTAAPVADLTEVREYLRSTIRHVYAPTDPAVLRAKGLTVHLGPTRFVDPHTLQTGEQRVRARRILICTGAMPRRPELPGLEQVPYVTYREIFEQPQLPASMVVIGGGPVGCELAQSYQRLGTRVTLVAERLLPRAEPEASTLLLSALESEGLTHVPARARRVRREGRLTCVQTTAGEAAGELLLVAVGRVPALDGLALDAAGVRAGTRSIEVNARLQTSVPHIYAAGDVVGGPQFSHLAGWQAFQATRNALLPGSSRGLPKAVPEVTFTVPEVAQIGFTERAARERFGDAVHVGGMDLGRVDRAVSEDDTRGFVKLIADRNGRLLGATVMGERAGEALAELALALFNKLTLRDLAAGIHPYPTYNSAIQLIATHMAVEQRLSGWRGRLMRALSRASLWW